MLALCYIYFWASIKIYLNFALLIIKIKCIRLKHIWLNFKMCLNVNQPFKKTYHNKKIQNIDSNILIVMPCNMSKYSLLLWKKC